METTINVIKGVGSLATSIGIGAVTRNVIKVTTPENTKTVVKVCIGVGSYFVAGLASAAASKKFGEQVDSVAEIIKKWTGPKEEPVVENMETKEEA